ncbi:MAG: 1,4-alpha-glucan branching protein domain-containing protein, partial [Ignavibacteriales bacterium]
TELFGHWWWEGVDWIEEVMRQVAKRDDIRMVTPSHLLKDWDRLAEAQVFESSWGVGGKHFGWCNPETSWMWDTISKAREEYNSIAHFAGGDMLLQTIKQAEKELMLMESSDWFFMVTNNHTRDYAMKRFFNHYAKLMRLTDMVKSDRFDTESVQWLRGVQKEDQLFNI